ncbi:hypothetical protein KUTeg_020071 [Tegillarca granosa]|uniref:UspA domain-containing protein n=1 Tax=Tegillarca granosa TaxID=220873 RepID=A0ABQ9E6Q9_TEGGR|nr:hypothetical protein KUTeg_020071 [Tegillarca granosa]
MMRGNELLNPIVSTLISILICVHGNIIRRDGHVGEVIVKTAESHGADLIVIGSHGIGTHHRSLVQTFRKVLVGRTSTFVLHHSTVPVIIFFTHYSHLLRTPYSL